MTFSNYEQNHLVRLSPQGPLKSLYFSG